MVKEITYDTYGNILLDTNPNMKVPFGFAGGLHDTDTKLVHFGYREYDPHTGKWTAKDPIDFSAGDSNLYGYVLGNPVGFIDPEGLKVIQTAENIKSGIDMLGFVESIRKFFGNPDLNNSIDLSTQILQLGYGVNGKRIKDTANMLENKGYRDCISSGLSNSSCEMIYKKPQGVCP